MRVAILLLGLVGPQVWLYAPSLMGTKLLLPLDNLTKRHFYVPTPPEQKRDTLIIPQNTMLDDIVLSIEFRRQLAIEAVRQGRLPLWNPYNFCGAPFLAANNTAVFSPFRLLDYAFPSPVTVAWKHLLKTLLAGIGAYLFFRTALKVGFWPAALGAWAFPLTGFFVLWQGFPPSFVAAWLPWVLLATHAAVRRPYGWGGPSLALVTAAMLVSGHAGTAAHVLLVSGFYALWQLAQCYGLWKLVSRAALASVAATVLGWGLAVLLTSPQNLPTIEYLQQSHRVEKRADGLVEFPPLGPQALPLLVLPYIEGAHVRGAIFLQEGNRLESPAQGYSGLLLTLVLAPLAFCGRQRKHAVFWLGVGVFAVSHAVGIPGLLAVFDLFPLNLLQNNRFVFVTAWSMVVLAVLGFEALRRDEIGQRIWFWAFVGLTGLLAGWCAFRAVYPPEPVREYLADIPPARALHELRDEVQGWFAQMYVHSALLSAIACLGWLNLRGAAPFWRRVPWMVSLIVVGEFVWNAQGVNSQCEPELYYPEIPALAELAERPPGRVCGINAMPPSLNLAHRLPSLRGYDGALPARMAKIYEIAQDPDWPHDPQVDPQWLKFQPTADSPLMDMLGVRYRIYREPPPPDEDVIITSLDYWIVENPRALPRPYVPRRVEVAAEEEMLERISRADFAPAEVAYVEGPLRHSMSEIRGTATLVEEEPCRLLIHVDMQTPGVVVLSDLWYPGWKAYVDGIEVPVMVANYAIRAVEVPPGRSELEFRYEPESLRRGFRWGLVGLGLWLPWCLLVAVIGLKGRRREAAGDP